VNRRNAVESMPSSLSESAAVAVFPVLKEQQRDPKPLVVR